MRFFVLLLLLCLSTAQGQDIERETDPSITDDEASAIIWPEATDETRDSRPGAAVNWGSCMVIPPPPPPSAVPEGEIDIQGGQIELQLGGDTRITNGITLTSGDHSLTADSARFSSATNVFAIEGDVEFRDSETQVKASGAEYNHGSGEVKFDNAQYKLWSVPARGSSEQVRIKQAGTLQLTKVRYTSCPEGKNDWILSASKIRIDQNKGIGTARNAMLKFKRVPILWLPYISYPASDKRKTGLLIPDFGTNSARGVEIEVPFYWNIAPQLDATITPRLMTKRGLQMRGETRYLTKRHEGVLTGEYLANDDVTDTSRALAAIRHESNFGSEWRGIIDATIVSDDNYFEDLSSGLATTSQTNLLRRADMEFFNNVWSGLLRVEDYQTIDPTIAPDDQPYQTLPKLAVHGLDPNGILGLEYGLVGELAYFTRDVGVTGVRGHIRPEVSYPIDLRMLTVEPAFAYDYTAYALDDLTPGEEENPSRNLPIFSVNFASTFERLTPKRGWLQTLEPRVLYTYIPYQDQNDLPVFDTIQPDLNLVQLFRKNRYVGYDRLGDTNQLSLGITTRLIDAADGDEFLRATIGEILYFSDREVTLPGGMPADSSKSDYLLELGVKLGEKWRTWFGYQYDSDIRKTIWTEARLNYRSAGNKLANFAYRYRRNSQEEFDISAAWPVGGRWNLIGRYNYSILDRKSLEALVGAEYTTCCWAIRTSVRRYLASRTGDSDTSFSVQLILKGFGSTDSAADRLLDRGILSYY